MIETRSLKEIKQWLDGEMLPTTKNKQGFEFISIYTVVEELNSFLGPAGYDIDYYYRSPETFDGTTRVLVTAVVKIYYHPETDPSLELDPNWRPHIEFKGVNYFPLMAQRNGMFAYAAAESYAVRRALTFTRRFGQNTLSGFDDAMDPEETGGKTKASW